VKQLLILSLLILPFTVYSQTVILHEDVSKLDVKMPTNGPNFKHFHQLYLNYSFLIPLDDANEIETDFWRSYIFVVGWRYKRKLTNWFSLGTGLSYSNEIHYIKQGTNKQIPNTIVHDKEKLKFNNAGIEVYMRFNFGKRGNVIGKFIDLGAYGEYAFSVKHFYQDNYDKSQPPYYSGTKKVNETNLGYVNKVNYGLRARIGVNRWVITASYRLSNLLTDDYRAIFGEYAFSKLSVGLEIGLHK
jgi:hypothetical protein